MLKGLIPIGMIVVSGVCYHTVQKMVPNSANPLGTLSIAYVIAFCITFGALLLEGNGLKTGFEDIVRQVHWSNILLGASVVGLELGFLMAYRSGWAVSIAGLLSNSLIAILLIPMGVICFKETLTFGTLTGIVICMVGLAVATTQ